MATTDSTGANGAPVVILTREQRDGLHGMLSGALDQSDETPVDPWNDPERAQVNRRQLEAVFAVFDEIGWARRGVHDSYSVTVPREHLVPVVCDCRDVEAVDPVADERVEVCDIILDQLEARR